MTDYGQHPRSYMEVLESILQGCPCSKTDLYYASRLSYTAFIRPRYFKLLLSRGLIRRDKNLTHLYAVQKGTDAYLLTPKGERYLKLIAEAKELLGIGG